MDRVVTWSDEALRATAEDIPVVEVNDFGDGDDLIEGNVTGGDDDEKEGGATWILETNANNAADLFAELEVLLTETSHVEHSLHVYKNQEAILRQSSTFEEETVSSLIRTLQSLRQECRDIKRSIREERMQRVAELNDELDIKEEQLKQLRRQNAQFTEELAALSTEFEMAENQLKLHSDSEWMQQERNKQQEARERATLKRTDDFGNQPGERAILANERMFSVLVSLPSNGRANEFLATGSSKPITVARELRALGDYIVSSKDRRAALLGRKRPEHIELVTELDKKRHTAPSRVNDRPLELLKMDADDAREMAKWRKQQQQQQQDPVSAQRLRQGAR